MTDHPIIFSAPMIRALINGHKTQTRRVCKEPWGLQEWDGKEWRPIPRYAIGDRLWVREAFATDGPMVRYYATDDVHELRRKKSPIHMPRWASRLTLIVTDARVQRVHDISEADAQAEGARPAFSYPGWDGVSSVPRYTWGFHELWETIHGPESWAANPWVAAINFDVRKGNIDA